MADKIRTVVKVWCLPRLEQESFESLQKAIVAEVVRIPELDAESEEDLCVLFPGDLMSYGLGAEIVIEVSTQLKTGESLWVTDRIQHFNNQLHNLGVRLMDAVIGVHKPRKMVAIMTDAGLQVPIWVHMR